MALSFLALAAQASFGYIRLGYTETVGGAFVPLARIDAAAIQYYLNDQVKAGQISTAIGAPVTVVAPGSDPVGAIRAAMATWNGAPNSGAKFLPLKSTSAGHNSSDFQMTIAFASSDDLSFLGFSPGKSMGAIAVTANAWTVEKGLLSNGTAVDKGNIVDADILLNSALTFSTDGSTPFDVQAVVTHELGHALGANHSGLLGGTMFPFSTIGTKAVLGQRFLSSDDAAFAGAVYGTTAGFMGTIGGKVVMTDGSVVKAALISLIDRTAGNTLGTITGSDGTWSLAVPPGSYIVYAEPFNNIVSASNIISLDPSQVTSGYQTAMLGGIAQPTNVAVAAGANVTGINMTVTTNTGQLNAPFQAVGIAGGSGDIKSVNSATGPLTIQSGTSFDLAVLSGGVDATTTIQVFGQGISVHAGTNRVDTKVSYPQGPLIRATIDVAPRQSPTLATVMIVKGTNVFALSGLFVVVPPKPTFVSKGIVNAASYAGQPNGDGVVSPGGLYSIYDIPGAPNLGPGDFAVPNGYDAYGNVPANLSGVGVTFDGIPAPMFLSFNSQLNVQVPFELAGKTTTVVQTSYNGSLSDPVTVAVVPSQPAFFTVTPQGTDSIAGNQDYSLNTDKNPEARGRVVTIYGTGIGKSSYVVETGKGAPGPPAGYSGNSSCTLDKNTTVSVAFTGWTPQTVGLAQWSMVLPQNSPTGKVAVTCTDPNGFTTPAGTLYIK